MSSKRATINNDENKDFSVGYLLKNIRQIRQLFHLDKNDNNLSKSKYNYAIKEKAKIFNEYNSFIKELSDINYDISGICPNEILLILLSLPRLRSYDSEQDLSYTQKLKGININIPATLICGSTNKPILLKSNKSGFLER